MTQYVNRWELYAKDQLSLSDVLESEAKYLLDQSARRLKWAAKWENSDSERASERAAGLRSAAYNYAKRATTYFKTARETRLDGSE